MFCEAWGQTRISLYSFGQGDAMGVLDKTTKLSFSKKALGRAVIGSTCRTYRSPPFPFHKALSITLEALG